ncbi:MAG TPA: alanine racemase [Thermoanaerobaculia bacterium]|nr:alanine racemase [Thermoanaerobaculia bacterium]
MTRSIEELPTPAVLVDLDVLERNIARQASRAREAGVKLRPHAKTHKCPEIARMQLAAGAAGISLAKTSEAEAFAGAGFEDIFVAYPVVGLGKAERLLALSDRLRLAVGTDSVEGATRLSEVFSAAGRKLDVLIKVDCGYHRVGIDPEKAVRFAARIADLPGIRLRGIFTHAGHVYSAESIEAVAAIGRQEGEILVAAAAELREMDFAIEEVSVGSTPSARYSMRVAGVTECRPGNYVFHDGSQAALGTCAPEDCAMTILATVVSVPAPGRAVVDAGSKTLSQDPLKPWPGGNGLILGTKTRLVSLTEEHGVARVAEGDRFRVGERVKILPNHACVVSNLHDRLYGVRADRVETVFEIAARGRIE